MPWRGTDWPSRRSVTGVMTSTTENGSTPNSTQAAASSTSAARMDSEASVASAAAAERGPPEEDDAVGAHEEGRGERRRQRQQRADDGDAELQRPLRQVGAGENRLEGQPLRHEAVERRQRRQPGGADQHGHGRHAACGG